MPSVPKPKKVAKVRKPLKRSAWPRGRSKRSQHSGGHAFPKVKHPAFRKWLRRTQPCLLAARWTTRRLSTHDLGDAFGAYLHRCWGPIDPAHVGQHQATGAADLGHCVPLCRAAHRFYDEHRDQWDQVTLLTEKRLEALAANYAVLYQREKGAA